MKRTMASGEVIEVNEDLAAFAIQLATAMDELSVSRKALAYDLGVHINTINNWLHAKTDPGIINLIKISNYFNVSVEWLLGF